MLPPLHDAAVGQNCELCSFFEQFKHVATSDATVEQNCEFCIFSFELLNRLAWHRGSVVITHNLVATYYFVLRPK